MKRSHCGVPNDAKRFELHPNGCRIQFYIARKDAAIF